MADNNSSYAKPPGDLPTQPLKISGVTRPGGPITTAPGKTKVGREKSLPWLLGGLFLGATGFIVCAALAFVVYNFGDFSKFTSGGQPPAAVSISTPVDGSKPGSAVQPPAAGTPIPTQADAPAPTRPVAAVPNVPTTALAFDQTQLDAFTIQLADLVVLNPDTTWSEVSTYQKLADWATAATAQALTAAGEQHMSGTGFRSQNTSTGTAVVTSTVHEFGTSDGAQKGVGIMAADVKTTLTNMLVIQTTVTLQNGTKAPVTLVTGSLHTGTYVFFIANYRNMVVNVAVGGFDSSSAGLDALVKDGKTLGQQMLDRIAGAAPVQ